MKILLRTFAVIAGLALAMPVLAQRGTSPSITNGSHLGYPAASILTPNNMRFGDSAPRGGHRFGSFATPQFPMRSFNPQWDRREHREHHLRGNFSYPYYPAYYYDPYLYGDTYVESSSSLPGAGTFNTQPQPPANEGDAQYPQYRPYVESNSVIDSQGHIYDRRPERTPEPPSAEAAQPSSTSNAQEDYVRTLLVFKDGHQMEVSNYAIMGPTLYLFAGDHRKISLADLDLDATRKANDERGTEFRVPNPS
jgi:hypothetical protein